MTIVTDEDVFFNKFSQKMINKKGIPGRDALWLIG